MKYVAYALKAVYATVVAFLGSLVTVMVGDAGFGDITDGQWVAAVLVGLVAGGGVFGLRNVPPSE
jgi:hypothetical protein